MERGVAVGRRHGVAALERVACWRATIAPASPRGVDRVPLRHRADRLRLEHRADLVDLEDLARMLVEPGRHDACGSRSDEPPCATKRPRVPRVSIRPSASRLDSASRSTVRETPSSSTSTRSGGRRSPAASFSSRICERIASVAPSTSEPSRRRSERLNGHRREELVGELERVPDEQLARLGRNRRRLAEVAMGDDRLVAAERVLAARRDVADQVVRVAERDGERRGRALLHLAGRARRTARTARP